MTDQPPGLDVYDLLRRLRAAGIHPRVDSIRDDALMVDVALPGQLWEIEFFPDGEIEFERFTSDGKILDAEAFAALIAKWADPPAPARPFDRVPDEIGLMRRLREAGISFWTDEMRMRKLMIDGAIMIEAAVPGERWEIDLLAGGEIEVERFESQFVKQFDARARDELFAALSDRSARPRMRTGSRF
jgi:hypothetical protein